MTVTSSNQPEQNIVYFQEPPTKAPPLLAVGPLAWIRNNLFSSWLDALLTFLGIGFIITILTTFFQWSINQADWFSVIFNIRQFMVGRMETMADWRVAVLVLLVAFATGLAWTAWSGRIPRIVGVITVVIVALLFIIPPVISAVIPLPGAYLVAGNQPIASGSLTVVAQDQLAFIARAGDKVTFRIADEIATDDPTLATLFSFSDNTANTLRAAADTNLASQARIDQINALLAGEDLTARQRTNLENDLGRIETPQVITETYSINKLPVNLRILDGATLEPVAETVLQPGGDTFSLTLSRDGWYVIDKTITGGDGLAILATTGIYPMLQRSFTRGEELDANGEVITQAGRVDQFVRMTDNYVLEAPQPSNAGTNIPYSTFIEFKYRGDRPLRDYMSLFFGPFVNILNTLVLGVVIATAVGYAAGRLADSLFSPVEKPRRASQRAASWMLIALPFLMFVLVAGFGNIDPRQGGGLLLTIILTLVIYWVVIRFIGDRSLGDYLRLFSGPLVTILIILILGWEFRGAAVLGYAAGFIIDTVFPPSKEARSLSQRALRWLLIAIPFLIAVLLAWVGSTIGVVILPTDPRRWGGLLLTMILTVVGIIGSFPIGILLALGRRSSLPIVKLACTVYIEVVRGVPFISVLFMGALLLPLTNPALSEVPGAYRAMIATIIFSAAYLAENVRGGLQSIPPGQEEAAKAIGLSGWQTTLYIILPQALRAVIPALVGMFIGLFKDTSLVAIVGLIDLTGITNSVVGQTEFLGDRREAFLFISIIYFVFSYVISYVSRRIESSGAGAAMAKRI